MGLRSVIALIAFSWAAVMGPAMACRAASVGVVESCPPTACCALDAGNCCCAVGQTPAPADQPVAPVPTDQTSPSFTTPPLLTVIAWPMTTGLDRAPPAFERASAAPLGDRVQAAFCRWAE